MRTNEEIAQNLEGLIKIKSQRFQGPLTKLVTVIRSLPVSFYDYYITQGYSLPPEVRRLNLKGINREYLFKAIFGVNLVEDEQDKELKRIKSNVHPTNRPEQRMKWLEREGMHDEW